MTTSPPHFRGPLTLLNSMILGFDLDGVILDHTGLKIALAKNLGFDLTPEHTPSEIIKKMLPEEHLVSLQHSLYYDPETCAATFVMRGAEMFFAELCKKNIPYYLISRRRVPETAISVLQEKGLWPQYFNESNTFFVTTPEEKNDCAKKLGVTHYLDDEPKVLTVLADVSHRFLLDQHGVLPASSAYTTVRSLQEFQKYIA